MAALAYAISIGSPMMTPWTTAAPPTVRPAKARTTRARASRRAADHPPGSGVPSLPARELGTGAYIQPASPAIRMASTRLRACSFAAAEVR